MSRSVLAPISAGRPRKSPLRVAAGSSPSFPDRRPDGRQSPARLRAMMISEFEEWLRSRTNKEKRPFQEETVLAYAKAARALDAWMTGHDVDGDFTACDTALLNRFFRDYNDAHTRGGTNTKQRNLRHLFTWLEADYDLAPVRRTLRVWGQAPWSGGLSRVHRCLVIRPVNGGVGVARRWRVRCVVQGASRGTSAADVPRGHAVRRLAHVLHQRWRLGAELGWAPLFLRPAPGERVSFRELRPGGCWHSFP